jgi:hypothetical protein
MDRDKAVCQHQAERNEGAEEPLGTQEPLHPDLHDDSPRVDSCSEETPDELRRSRSLSPQWLGPIRRLSPSLSLPKINCTRKKYNRLVGDSLQTDSQQNVQDVVANSLKLMDDLLVMVSGGDLCPDPK